MEENFNIFYDFEKLTRSEATESQGAQRQNHKERSDKITGSGSDQNHRER
jgi:hypothetical protein